MPSLHKESTDSLILRGTIVKHIFYLHMPTGIIIGTMLGGLLLIVLIYITIVAIFFYQKRPVSSKHSLEKGPGGEQFRYVYKHISKAKVTVNVTEW